MIRIFFWFALGFYCDLAALAQGSLRGLSVVSDKVVWASGSKGTVMLTQNGGKKWKSINPVGYKNKDFRDIHAWNAKEAIVMSAGDSAVFLKTYDGGKTWKKVYANNSQGVFFDAIDFVHNCGVAIGDPMQVNVSFKQQNISIKPFYFLITKDRGETWNWPSYYVFPNDSTEAMFAASGSIIKLTDTTRPNFQVRFITGGLQPRFLSSEGLVNLPIPILKGPGCGAYSFHWSAPSNKNQGVICAVGGCWQYPNKTDSTCVFSLNNGLTWQLSDTMPLGYRSSVCADASGSKWFCTGTNGTDISTDQLKTWHRFSPDGFNVCACSNKYLWLAGNQSQIKKIALK